MFEERIAALNKATEEAQAFKPAAPDKRTYTVDEIQDILGKPLLASPFWCICRSIWTR